MSKSNDASKLGDITLDGHRAIADGELALVSGGMLHLGLQAVAVTGGTKASEDSWLSAVAQALGEATSAKASEI
jgi:ABC transporter substrate binding protein